MAFMRVWNREAIQNAWWDPTYRSLQVDKRDIHLALRDCATTLLVLSNELIKLCGFQKNKNCYGFYVKVCITCFLPGNLCFNILRQLAQLDVYTMVFSIMNCDIGTVSRRTFSWNLIRQLADLDVYILVFSTMII